MSNYGKRELRSRLLRYCGTIFIGKDSFWWTR